MPNLVSIIVPNYNHAAFMEQRLESIFNQSYQDFEVILLDDASKDASVAILSQYSNHPKVSHFEVNEVNSGSPFKQWYKGIILAKGAFVWIAESDDFCSPLFLENVVKFYEHSSQDIGIVYTQSLDINEDGSPKANRIEWTAEFDPNIWRKNFVLSGDEFIKGYLKVKNVIPNASAVVFRSELLQKDSFSEDLVEMEMCGDWYFWIKHCSKTTIGFISTPLNYFREHANISRKHNSRSRRIKRLTEEGKLRRFMAKERPKIDQKEEINKLYKNWFTLFSLRDLLDWKFYQILCRKYHYPQFLISFLKSKIHG